MRKEMEEIREKVHTTADAALFLCFQELNGSHSKGVIHLPLLHYDVPFAGYGEMREAVCEACGKKKKTNGNLRRI